MIAGTHRSDITIRVVLLARTGDGHEEHDNPGNADLEPHLEVDGSESWVQDSAHKHVVNEVPRHTNLVPSRNREEVHAERHAEADDHRDGHEMTEIVDDGGEAEDAVVVQDGGGDHGNVDAVDGVALVHEGAVVERGDGETFLHVTGHDPGKEELVDDEAGVHLPRVQVRARVLDAEVRQRLRHVADADSPHGRAPTYARGRA